MVRASEAVFLLTLLLALAVIFAPVMSPRVRGFFGRLSLAIFGQGLYRPATGRRSDLGAAYIAEPRHIYRARTFFYTGVMGAIGSVLGMTFIRIALLLGLTEMAPRPSTPPPQIAYDIWEVVLSIATAIGPTISLLIVSGLTFGFITAVSTYAFRQYWPQYRASARSHTINEGMLRTIAFLYALSRGGMPFSQVLRTFDQHRSVYGATAQEIGVTVRHMDLFGDDVITALEKTARRSPSDRFQVFIENLTSVLQSGRSVSEFLRIQYDQHLEEIEAQQREILDRLALTAEVYVSVMVAGILFLITILTVMGLTVSNTLQPIKGLTYAVIPLASLGFIVYLDTIMGPLKTEEEIEDESEDVRFSSLVDPDRRPDDDQGPPANRTTVADGGTVEEGGYRPPEPEALKKNLGRLAAYRRSKYFRELLSKPVESILERPLIMLYLVLPPVLLWLGIEIIPMLVTGTVDLRAIDDMVVIAVIILFTPFAIVRGIHNRAIERIEREVPDFLDRLASLNEAGLSVIGTFRAVRRNEFGALNDEIERIWRDIHWGATVEESLQRFKRRTGTAVIARSITLAVNAMRANSNIGPVLRISGQQARADRRLHRQRSQEMFMYVVIVYISFLVFLVIIGMLDTVFLPALPSGPPAGTNPQATTTGGFQFQSVDIQAYRLVFFHSALIQAVFSGLVAGQMGEGSVQDGAKHAVIMLTIAYVTFLLI